MKDYLKDGVPQEFETQKKAGKIEVERKMGRVLKVFDWYVYDYYYIINMEYDENFKSLYDLYNAENPICEEKCKYFYLLLSDLVFKLNGAEIYHLDLKPTNVLYSVKSGEIKLIDLVTLWPWKRR